MPAVVTPIFNKKGFVEMAEKKNNVQRKELRAKLLEKLTLIELKIHVLNGLIEE